VSTSLSPRLCSTNPSAKIAGGIGCPAERTEKVARLAGDQPEDRGEREDAAFGGVLQIDVM